MTPDKESEIRNLTEKHEAAREKYYMLGQMNTSHLDAQGKLELATKYNLALAAMNEAKRGLERATI